MSPEQNVLVLTASPLLKSSLDAVLHSDCRYKSADMEFDLTEVRKIAGLTAKTPDIKIIAEVSLSPTQRSSLTGVRLAQELRKNYRRKGLIVFLGFLDPEEIERQGHLIVSAPGSMYLRLPATSSQILDALQRVDAIDNSTLKEVVKKYCGLEEDVKSILHRVSNLLVSIISERQPHADIIDLKASSSVFIRNLRSILHWLDLSPENSKLDSALICLSNFDALKADEAREALESLAVAEHLILSALHPPSSGFPIGQTPMPSANDAGQGLKNFESCASAPLGYETILVADDDGYPAESISYLVELNYHVEVVTDVSEAEANITADPMAVLLCDQTFGTDPTAGRRLMSLARQNGGWKLILALSGSSLEASEVPEADGVCSGALAKMEEGARRLHEMICEWATSHP